ncbi:MAG: zinc resistance-associated protein [Alphaproteobacteria bacterium]|nr:zinc resistance-associated protein [Alphaproteobacteria bacterium]
MTLWKKSAVGAAALMLAGSMMVYAQQRPEGPAVRGPGGFGGPGIWRPSPEDMGAFVDARIAALHAGLRLNPDQEKSWPAFEQALRESARLRLERRAAEHNEPPAAGPVDRLQRRADAMTTRGAAMTRVADAAAPLYQSLDDGQKRRFAMLARFMGPRGRHHGMGQEHRGGPGGMRSEDEFRSGPRRFGSDEGMRGPHRMHRGDEDYRGPL